MDIINDEDLKRLEKLTSDIQPPAAAIAAIRDERIEEEQIIKVEKMEKDNENLEFRHSGVGLSRLRMLNKNDDIDAIPKTQTPDESKINNIPEKYIEHVSEKVKNENTTDKEFFTIQKLLDIAKLLCDDVKIESSLSEYGLSIHVTVGVYNHNNYYTSKLSKESLKHDDIYMDIITWLVCCINKSDRLELSNILMNVLNFLKGENKCI